jgi:hypothetical protein
MGQEVETMHRQAQARGVQKEDPYPRSTLIHRSAWKGNSPKFNVDNNSSRIHRRLLSFSLKSVEAKEGSSVQ